uniref:G-protein coupled receptors family 1 profile domain-containing protein n=1 Tax=Panagrolaimus davidi TaxID=227884 RepID=A0A914PCG8_9BILA
METSINITTTAGSLLSSSSSILPPKTIPLTIQMSIIAYCYILPTVCVFGIIGNLMNVITLASRRLRAVSYMYLRALAIADLICMIFVLIFASLEVLQYKGYSINENYFYGFYQAHLMLSFINWALATGVLVVVALSLERYVSIIHPLRFRAWNSPNRAWVAIIIAYSIPIIFYFPYSIGRYSIGQKISPTGQIQFTAIDSEVSKTTAWQIYKWTREVTLRFAPIALLCYLNGRIMYAFRRRQRMFSRLTNRETTQSNRDDTLLYILGGIVVMFFICNIPAAINLLFINETVKKRVDYQVFRAVANILEITNHAAQFYIFCACSTDYRSTFLLKFPCFKAYYTNRDRFKSLMRRQTPKDLSEKSVVNGVSAVALEKQFQKQSTTATADAISSAATPAKEPIIIHNNHHPHHHVLKLEKEIVDIHLASGEEDLFSEESDSLLQYGVVADLDGDANGTTYL